MARRKKSSFNPLLIVGAVAALGLGAGAIVMLKGKSTDAYAGVSQLDPNEYVSNAISLQGNTYHVTAKVKEQIRYTDSGRLYAMEAKDDKTGQMVDLSVLFPSSFAHESIQVGQEMDLKVEVKLHAILTVLDLKRS
jgi:hypothetical protein